MIDLTGRKKEKLAQKVKNLDDCLAKVEKRISKGETMTLEVKEDGLYSFWIMNEHNVCTHVLSRTGNALVNVESLQARVPLAFDRQGAYVIMGELCNPLVSLEELGAMVKSSRKKPLTDGIATKAKKATKTKPAVAVGDRIHFDEVNANEQNYLVAFDIISMDEFLEGHSDLPQRLRRQNLENSFSRGEEDEVECFYLAEQLDCGNLSMDAIRKVATKVIETGREGIVGKFDNAPWIAGGKTDNYFKIVSGYDVDLICVDVEIGQQEYNEKGEHHKRYGIVNKLIFQWRKFGKPDGELTKLALDGRATDEMRVAWAEDPGSVLGKVFHIHGLCVGSQGSIRLGKFFEERLDKDQPDL